MYDCFTFLLSICADIVLDRDHKVLADFYTQQKNTSAASTHNKAADALKAAILDLLWDPVKLAFYDFNLTSNARNDFYSVATFYPVWSGIIPDALANSTEAAFGYFSAVNLVLNKFNGTFPVTFISSGQQWYVLQSLIVPFGIYC